MHAKTCLVLWGRSQQSLKIKLNCSESKESNIVTNLIICSAIFFKLAHIAISLLNILQHMLSSCGYKDIDMCQSCDYHVIVMWLLRLPGGRYRSYAINVIISNVTKHETDSGWQARHYTLSFEWSMERKYSGAVCELLSHQRKKWFYIFTQNAQGLNKTNAHWSK